MRPKRPWTLLVIIITVVAIGGIVAWSMRLAGEADEIEIIESPPIGNIAGEVYIGGEVGCPGYYKLRTGDNLLGLIQAAGGVSDNEASEIEVRVVCDSEARTTPQKIDINRAEVWLLEALPGIGQEKAQAICDYRNEAGRFDSVYDLLQVTGIGPGILEEISPLITVSD